MRKALIRIAPNMDAESLALLEKGIKENFGSDVVTEKSIDDSIVGGFIVSIDGTVYDYSAGTKLKNLKKFINE